MPAPDPFDDAPSDPAVTALAACLTLGDALAWLRRHGTFTLEGEHAQGEFHHDVFLRCDVPALPGPYVVVSTNCNGGIKEVFCFAAPVSAVALWHARDPGNPDFDGVLPLLLARARTLHHFDACELLAEDARSELRPEFRERSPGGGWRRRS